MIENKVLVTVNVPSLENRYDVYIPVNKKIYSVIKMLCNSLVMLSQGAFVLKDNYLLYDSVISFQFLRKSTSSFLRR